MASSSKTRPTVPSEGSLLVPGKSRTTRQQLARPHADPSVLRPSISVAITGMKQAVKALENGSPEIRNYLLHECNVVYECKACSNLFRSLANFIAHKRSFCRERFQDVRHVFRRDPGEYHEAMNADLTSVFVQPEDVETLVPDENWDINQYSPSLELLKEAGFIHEIESRPVVSRLMPEKKPKLESVVNRLKERQIAGADFDYYRSKELQHSVTLEGIRQTTQAVFQTMGTNCSSTMGQRYVELQRLKNRPSVFLGPDGKVIHPGPPPPELSPFNGNGGDSEKENLVYHCPLCKKSFALLKNVYRHLIRFHKKSSEEAERIRKKSEKRALMKQHKSLFGNIRFGENAAGVQQPHPCKKCFKVFPSLNDRLCHEIFCLPPPTVRLERLKLKLPKVKLEKLPMPVIIKATTPVKSDVAGADRKRANSGGDDSSKSLVSGLLEDDEDEVTFKANEDKDSGIGNGNASEESADESQDAPSPRKRMRPASVAAACNAATVIPKTPPRKKEEMDGDAKSSPERRKNSAEDVPKMGHPLSPSNVMIKNRSKNSR